ncbi:MAG: hypothetical protein ACOC1G_06935 [Phycisphaeraceae bacterium]
MASIVVHAVMGYLALGLGFAIFFAVRGVQGCGEAARRGTWGFRVVIVPGAMLLWPLLLLRMVQRSRP